MLTSDHDLGRRFIMPYGTIFPAALHAYARSTHSRETVLHVVPFNKCTYACCRTFFVGNAYASSLLPTLDKPEYWFLLTKFSTYNWSLRISTLPRTRTLWTGFRGCELSGGVVTLRLFTGKWKPHRALSLISLVCVTGSTAVYNTIDDRDASAHVTQALPSPILPTGSATPYFLRSSDPEANFFARPFARPFPFLLDFDLRETFFRRSRPPLRVLFFGKLKYRPSLDNVNTVWPSVDLYHNLHIIYIGLFLSGPYSLLQILFVVGAYWFPSLFPCSIRV